MSVWTDCLRSAAPIAAALARLRQHMWERRAFGSRHGFE